MAGTSPAMTRIHRVLAPLHLPLRTPRPIFPGPVERIVIKPPDDLVDFAGAQKFNLAKRHRLHLQLGADFQIDRDEYRMPDRAANDRGAVAAHQCGRPRAEKPRQIAAHVHIDTTLLVSDMDMARYLARLLASRPTTLM